MTTSPVSPSGKKILVVDDQESVLDLTATVLVSAGYEVVTVNSGMKALDLLGEEAFDLTLLDINMPRVDGWETLRMIRADPNLEDLPVVMFSVKSQVLDKMVGMQEGALDYICKPFEVDELLQRVGKVFDNA